MISEEQDCYVCGGTLAFMGTLGNYLWYRCIQCGMEAGYKVDDGTQKNKGEIIDLVGRDGEDEDGEWRQIE